jgi:putative ABC transport system substrate-binding protein
MLNKTNTQGKYHKLSTALILVTILAVLLSACGQAATPKVYHVGILSGLDFFGATADGFKAKMTTLGYVEGKNIVYDLQKTNFDAAAQEKILKKFVADKVDLIFVFPTEASIQAKAIAEGSGIPVLFANASLEGNKLVDSIGTPGGNTTGVQFPTTENGVKRFEIMHELLPDAKRIWVAYLNGYPTVAPELEALQPLAKAAGMTFVEVPATSPADIQADLDARSAMDDIGMDAILIIPEPLTAGPDAFAVIGKFAAAHKVPVGGALLMDENYSSIFGYTPDSVKVGEQAAVLADKIFKGAPAGTVAVASADSYLSLNYKMAQQLGITIPDGLLNQAVQVIR